MRQLPEEAQLRQVEGVVASAVRDEGSPPLQMSLVGRKTGTTLVLAQVRPPSVVRMTTVPPLT